MARFGRRALLKAGGAALAAAMLPRWTGGKAWAVEPQPKSPAQPMQASKAKTVILVYLAGGISQVESFDPKPENGQANGPRYFKTIPTNVPGIEVSEGIPLLAKQADKYSIIRSMTHPATQFHGISNYVMTTGTLPSDDIVYPSATAVMAYKKGDPNSVVPPYVFLTGTGEVFTEQSFLPSWCGPWATGGDPSQPDFTAGLKLGSGLTPERVQARQALFQTLDSSMGKPQADEQFREMLAYQDKVRKLLLSDARKAFDLSQEKKEVRERYGMNWAGQGMLLARRLVEADCGARVIKIYWRRGGGAFGGWDTHTDDHYKQTLNNQPDFDQGMSALFEDLAQRGLLETTMVLAGGEMGRQPMDVGGGVSGAATGKGGRGHHSTGFSWIVGGGGFKGGRVVGKTSSLCQVIEREVYPWDLWNSVYTLLGIDPADTLPYPLGCGRVRVSPLPPTSREMRALYDYQSDKGDNAVQRLKPYAATDERISGGLLTELL
ncbi:MAG: DUF1501 domain-containing protein [Thermoguttaceae bacterium]|jgi:hypothetical protein